MRTLAEQLRPRDRVAVVIYAGASGIALPSTTGDRKGEIISAVERLQPGGSTNGGAGIQLAYRVAEENFIRGGTNRVILATDGDFNVGVTSDDELVSLIEEKRKGGVFLSVLGFGTGNFNESMMEKLADKGNGNFAYIDTRAEAEKALGEQVARDARNHREGREDTGRVQPAPRRRLPSHRLREPPARRPDFNDDRKDAGEIGAGHSVTALYEVVPAGQKVENPGVDELKYAPPGRARAGRRRDELLTVKLRYKEPDGDESKPLNVGVARPAGELQERLGELQVRGGGRRVRPAPARLALQGAVVLRRRGGAGARLDRRRPARLPRRVRPPRRDGAHALRARARQPLTGTPRS